ncbi:MAG: 50S ribosomal protein L4, partial [Spirochaetaceae bacterium]|nr:50S ribosomal protein L4 [Spirochaetaceae bacterium]
MNCKVYSVDGKELRDIELEETVFGLPVNEDVIWYAINNELANKRQGNASTKDRGEVHGSNAKPYKQKGTGRARRGDKKSPVMVGGGVVFGPRPRDYSYTIPKKAKRLAIKSVLSLKAQNKTLKIIEDFSIESGKTRDLAGLLKHFSPGERTVLVLKDDDPLLKRAAANIPWLSYLSYNRLRAHDLFYGRQVLMLETAAKNLNA